MSEKLRLHIQKELSNIYNIVLGARKVSWRTQFKDQGLKGCARARTRRESNPDERSILEHLIQIV